jgi:hypothetical protein
VLLDEGVQAVADVLDGVRMLLQLHRRRLGVVPKPGQLPLSTKKKHPRNNRTKAEADGTWSCSSSSNCECRSSASSVCSQAPQRGPRVSPDHPPL